MSYGKEDVSVPGFFATFGGESDFIAAVGGFLTNGQERCRNIRGFFIPLNTVGVNQIQHLHHQAVFGFHAVMNGHCFTAGKSLNQLKDTVAKTGDVNADKCHVIARLNAADTLCHKLE
ncbi:hypothetical protein BvCmsNSNP019_05104 [Escherichia coli]|nr:hypothetical protein BvCmsNSNP019_05104 [Escherichia coli]